MTTAPHPSAVSIPQAPPGGFLEERLERQWAGAATSEDGSSPGTLALAAAAGPGRYGSSSFGLDGFNGGGDGPSKYRWAGGPGLCKALWQHRAHSLLLHWDTTPVPSCMLQLFPELHRPACLLPACPPDCACRQEMRLSIGGLEVRPPQREGWAGRTIRGGLGVGAASSAAFCAPFPVSLQPSAI